MSTFELQDKVNEMRELRRMAEELDAEIAAIQDSIKAHMEATGTDELNGADYKITWKPITSTRLDTAALKKALPEIAERFTKTTTTRRFVLA
jgi:predicted phage-related endonuclease